MFEREFVSEKRPGIEFAARNGCKSILQAFEITGGFAFVGIDDIESAPIPKLHVDLPRPVLMIPSDDEAAADFRQFAGKIKRFCKPGCFDRAIAKIAVGKFLNLFDDSAFFLDRKSVV